MATITKEISFCICQLFLILITCYQYTLSPILKLIGVQCRFYPSCSAYAKMAFQNHSLLKGLYLTIKRLLRCNPFFDGGCDFCKKNTNSINKKG
jgi:putative membrane protein insertion efficiency factor